MQNWSRNTFLDARRSKAITPNEVRCLVSSINTVPKDESNDSHEEKNSLDLSILLSEGNERNTNNPSSSERIV
jgi:hypothetical protein